MLSDLEKTVTLFLKSGYFVYLKSGEILFALNDTEELKIATKEKIAIIKNSNNNSNKVL